LDVDCLDQASGSRVDNVRGFGERHQHVWMDLTMPDSSNVLAKIMQEKKVSKVIHFAAKTHVDESFDGELSLKYTSTNVSGTHALLEACRRYGKLDLFLHVSTDEVYGDCDKNEATEASILQPTNPYAASKAAAEMLVKAYTHSLGLPCCIVRLNNVYGPRQHLNKVIPRFCNLAVQKKPLPLHGAGAARRCFIFASDAVQAVNVVIEKGTTGEVYNVGGGYELSIKELAEKIMSLAGLGGGVELVKDRPYNDMRYLLDDSKLRSMGWAPLKNFEEGLAETFCFYAAA
jgi:dTDP-glucose 4,6-dehydratase